MFVFNSIGAELRNWLLFFAIPVLYNILPVQFLSHLALLVTGVYIYSSQSISGQDFQLGQCLLQQFYLRFSDLYGNYIHLHQLSIVIMQCYLTGVKSTSMNIHLLSHLPECVRQWGPLWAYTCFHFENMNGYLKLLFHGTRDMTKQVCVQVVYLHYAHPTDSLLYRWHFHT